MDQTLRIEAGTTDIDAGDQPHRRQIILGNDRRRHGKLGDAGRGDIGRGKPGRRQRRPCHVSVMAETMRRTLCRIMDS